jgi:hypothetical protein
VRLAQEGDDAVAIDSRVLRSVKCPMARLGDFEERVCLV